MESERPTNLDSAALKAYEDELDETAFPFEEKAIKIHEKNMEMVHAGVLNEWTDKSLSRLVELMPGRYAKPELSSGFLDAIDTYVYRSPASQAPTPAPANAGNTPASPVPGPATGNAGSTQASQAPSPTSGNGGSTPASQAPSPTPGNAGSTPGAAGPTTQPAAIAVHDGGAKDANRQ